MLHEAADFTVKQLCMFNKVKRALAETFSVLLGSRVRFAAKTVRLDKNTLIGNFLQKVPTRRPHVPHPVPPAPAWHTSRLLTFHNVV